MPCTGVYATAWQFAAKFCEGTLLVGVHMGAGPADADLLFTQVDFQTRGMRANVGMILCNLTQGTQGYVTGVTPTTLTAAGVTWNAGDEFRTITLDALQIAAIDHNLEEAATDIHIALETQAMCDCTLSSGARNFLTRLNAVIALVFYGCTCGKPAVASKENRDRWGEWAQAQLDNLRTGKLEVCQGETGPDFPARADAQQSWTQPIAADIIAKDFIEESGD